VRGRTRLREGWSREAIRTRKDRLACGAKTRAGTPCLLGVEDGKAMVDCQPDQRTESGRGRIRARIAQAQRRRWAYVPRNKLPASKHLRRTSW
jgi:hypothetical protein